MKSKGFFGWEIILFTKLYYVPGDLDKVRVARIVRPEEEEGEGEETPETQEEE